MTSKPTWALIISVIVLYVIVYFTADRSSRFYLNNVLLSEDTVHVQLYANGEMILDENIKQNLISHRFSYSFKQYLNKANGISLEVVLPELKQRQKFKFKSKESDFVFITFSDVIEPYNVDMIVAQGLSSESVKKSMIPGL
ncbi:hypothetical protein [Roseivirga echinicomitans]|uniref:Uncharacterized protein n=1 Tax=Roseivirga echinicomitans TaxID=296218 RepID=A0A150X114_9BACT|nr:hypothetical protein [Roseivirga echinicomitans]KYG72419.1 hypothetical protein AWN68_11695 [Roseivirga echinicomitans]